MAIEIARTLPISSEVNRIGSRLKMILSGSPNEYPEAIWRILCRISLDHWEPIRSPSPTTDHLRPAAVKVGVLKKGEKVRFGFHNLRHSLASFLIRKGTDAKTVQAILRHSDVTTTLGIYAQSMSEDRLAAQDDMLVAMMTPSNAVH